MGGRCRRRMMRTRKSSPKRRDMSRFSVYNSNMQAATLISAEEFDLLAETDERRLEYFEGEVIEMASARPEHNILAGNICDELRPLARKRSLGLVLAESEFQIGPDRRLIPDLAFLSRAKAKRIDRAKTPILEIPDLAIEVLSPSESAAHVDRKITAYLDAGVTEVWVIIPETQHIYIHAIGRTSPLTVADTLQSAFFPGWSMPVSAVFDQSV